MNFFVELLLTAVYGILCLTALALLKLLKWMAPEEEEEEIPGVSSYHSVKRNNN